MIEQILQRSDELDEAVTRLIDPPGYRPANESPRVGLSVGAASLSIAHARALRLLVAGMLLPSAAGILRLQFEAITRAAWLLYAADESKVALLDVPLGIESEKLATKLPGATDMLSELAKSSAPAAAAPTAMLGQFKKMQWHALNSFVHGGIHPLRREAEGYPVRLVLQLVQCSNGLLTMSGMMLAVLTGNQLLAAAMNRIHVGFEDCITPMLAGY